jgi:GNAT superfamily N-acetyltransferase
LTIQIREADLNRDGAQIADALSKYLIPLADSPRFEWLYKRNPNGKARAWLALDNDDVIATGAVFPRRVYFNKTQIIAWVLGDFCVSDRHRTLGTAVALQRTLLQASDASGVPISYDFPSAAMTAVYKRLKIEPFGQMIRMARVLRVDRKLRERIGYEWLAKVLSPVGNALLGAAAAAFQPTVDKTLKVSLQQHKCGTEFDALANRVGMNFDFCVRRSADYLNWRYLDNPYKRHELMTARREESLLGFVVFSQNGLDGEIVDLFGEDDDGVIDRLIIKVVELFRRRGLITVSTELIASHPWAERFRKLGFYPRESKPFIVCGSSESAGAFAEQGVLLPHQSWFITGGDRDS